MLGEIENESVIAFDCEFFLNRKTRENELALLQLATPKKHTLLTTYRTRFQMTDGHCLQKRS